MASPSIFEYVTFPIVPASGPLNAPFTADVVPETPPLVFPAGWIVVARATINYQANTVVANAPSPAPIPPGGQVYGGLSGLTVREDPAGANVARASASAVLAFTPFSPDGTNYFWLSAAEMVAVGSFVSDGAPHTYKVVFTNPRYVGGPADGIAVIGYPNVNDIRLGLELFASPP